MAQLKKLCVLVLAGICITPAISYAQADLVPDQMTFAKAKVLRITHERIEPIPGTDTSTRSQTVEAEIVSGPEKGSIVTFENDYPVQLDEGETFYLRHTSNEIDGISTYSVADPYRLDILILLGIVFVVLAILFGGIQGLRGLASLGGSIVLIFYLLIPGILNGSSPVIVAVGVASLIIVLGSYITHGFNRTTSAAVIGMVVTVVCIGVASYFVMDAANLSGYTSEENVYLNFNTRGAIDMIGLLFAGIMIGLLGVLYDSAIGQAIAVEELFRAGKHHMDRLQVYRRAIRIGREHIGALINTLAIAYVGAALPLLLLIYSSSSGSIAFILNSEVIATEIVRILVGSIGLIAAVPITTLIASYMLAGFAGAGGTSEHRGHRH